MPYSPRAAKSSRFLPKTGRIVKVAGDSAVRYREARFLPDGKSIVALSTQSGETEFWKFAANGEGAPEQWTHDAKVLRWEGVPSPDGHWLAHRDKDQQLWIYDIKTKTGQAHCAVDERRISTISRWSPTAVGWPICEAADNQFEQIKMLNIESGAMQTITSDRYNSVESSWSSDGKWLYFLSDRNLKTTIRSPWGPRAARAALRSHREDLRTCAYDRPAFALPARRRTASRISDKKETKRRTTTKAKDAKPDGDKTADAAKSDADKNKKDETKKDEDKDKKKPAEVKIDFTDLGFAALTRSRAAGQLRLAAGH